MLLLTPRFQPSSPEPASGRRKEAKSHEFQMPSVVVGLYMIVVTYCPKMLAFSHVMRDSSGVGTNLVLISGRSRDSEYIVLDTAGGQVIENGMVGHVQDTVVVLD